MTAEPRRILCGDGECRSTRACSTDPAWSIAADSGLKNGGVVWALWGERYKKSMRLQKTEGVQWDTRHDFTGLSLDEPEGERFPLYLAFVCTGGARHLA